MRSITEQFTLEKGGYGMCYIRLTDAHFKVLSQGGNKRITIKVGPSDKVHLAMRPKTNLGHLLTVGTRSCKKLGIAVGDTFQATVAIDTSEYQFEFPEVFGEVLRTDLLANKAFENLTKGMQRSLLSYILAVTSEQKQIERSLKIADLLSQGITKRSEIQEYLKNKA
ncbi:MAG: YdeI/OmpD-associated family protein [Gilvibacter sp.]